MTSGSSVFLGNSDGSTPQQNSSRSQNAFPKVIENQIFAMKSREHHIKVCMSGAQKLLERLVQPPQALLFMLSQACAMSKSYWRSHLSRESIRGTCAPKHPIGCSEMAPFPLKSPVNQRPIFGRALEISASPMIPAPRALLRSVSWGTCLGPRNGRTARQKPIGASGWLEATHLVSKKPLRALEMHRNAKRRGFIES